MRDLANSFKALADETRLKMLFLLFLKGELCVCDFEQVLQISQSKASRHLRYLLNAGFLSDRRNGVWVHYRIKEKLSKDHSVLLHPTSKVLDNHEMGKLLENLEKWLEIRNSGCVGSSQRKEMDIEK